ncbi:AMP-binding protein [Lachnoclostridium pacaense]|uniref:AMP-binding protein n=1 Tax=Enterocloster hominis (ex Hitch et al. 2024) TaxID=1917870 RepID=UPI001D12B0D1|nr:AMP-binding protein [Lachnoclostridium pacaense]MCC2876903.1 AMP-binding protein [Lachnoclostridium pacaense]
MNYLEMLRAVPPHRTALIEDSRQYTYGEMVMDAQRCSDELLSHQKADKNGTAKKQSTATAAVSYQAGLPLLAWIKSPSVYTQLICFLACGQIGRIPVILPPDMRHPPSIPSGSSIPDRACMGVLTSGTTGNPRLLFRTFESWHGFFPVQNSIFGVDRNTRMFVHGSLAFTGNLNMYLALLSEGAALITCSAVHPPAWNGSISLNQANAIYLIPSKLRLLSRTSPGPADYVKAILTGSQSMDLKDMHGLKQAFPQSRCILYYGASELSYVSYLCGNEMTGNPACVGRPFPGVHITIQDGEIMADTPYRALGVRTPASAGDIGYLDSHGFLYLLGRRDNVYNIHGRKIPAALVEHALTDLDEISEAAVVLEHGSLTAYVVLNPAFHSMDAPKPSPDLSRRLMGRLQETLEYYQLPRRIRFLDSIPKNSSGKPILSLLSAAE